MIDNTLNNVNESMIQQINPNITQDLTQAYSINETGSINVKNKSKITNTESDSYKSESYNSLTDESYYNDRTCKNQAQNLKPNVENIEMNNLLNIKNKI